MIQWNMQNAWFRAGEATGIFSSYGTCMEGDETVLVRWEKGRMAAGNESEKLKGANGAGA